jgi:hypothetical protein
VTEISTFVGGFQASWERSHKQQRAARTHINRSRLRAQAAHLLARPLVSIFRLKNSFLSGGTRESQPVSAFQFHTLSMILILMVMVMDELILARRRLIVVEMCLCSIGLAQVACFARSKTMANRPAEGVRQREPCLAFIRPRARWLAPQNRCEELSPLEQLAPMAKPVCLRLDVRGEHEPPPPRYSVSSVAWSQKCRCCCWWCWCCLELES